MKSINETWNLFRPQIAQRTFALQVEERVGAARHEAALEASVEAATLAAMVDGPEKQRLELLHRQEEARRNLRQQQEDRITPVRS